MPNLEKYKLLIERFGGPKRAQELVMACIEPCVLGHEGKKILYFSVGLLEGKSIEVTRKRRKASLTEPGDAVEA